MLTQLLAWYVTAINCNVMQSIIIFLEYFASIICLLLFCIVQSFEEDLNSLVNSEMQRRRSSLLLPHDMISQHNDSITIKMTSDIGLEGMKPIFKAPS